MIAALLAAALVYDTRTHPPAAADRQPPDFECADPGEGTSYFCWKGIENDVGHTNTFTKTTEIDGIPITETVTSSCTLPHAWHGHGVGCDIESIPGFSKVHTGASVSLFHSRSTGYWRCIAGHHQSASDTVVCHADHVALSSGTCVPGLTRSETRTSYYTGHDTDGISHVQVAVVQHGCDDCPSGQHEAPLDLHSSCHADHVRPSGCVTGIYEDQSETRTYTTDAHTTGSVILHGCLTRPTCSAGTHNRPYSYHSSCHADHIPSCAPGRYKDEEVSVPYTTHGTLAHGTGTITVFGCDDRPPPDPEDTPDPDCDTGPGEHRHGTINVCHAHPNPTCASGRYASETVTVTVTEHTGTDGHTTVPRDIPGCNPDPPTSCPSGQHMHQSTCSDDHPGPPPSCFSDLSPDQSRRVEWRTHNNLGGHNLFSRTVPGCPVTTPTPTPLPTETPPPPPQTVLSCALPTSLSHYHYEGFIGGVYLYTCHPNHYTCPSGQHAHTSGTVDYPTFTCHPNHPPSAVSVSLTAQPHQIDGTWEDPVIDGGGPITDYDVQYRTGRSQYNKSTSSTVNPQTARQTVTPGPELDLHHVGPAETASVSGLVNGTAYQMRVRAENDAGEGAWGAWSEAIPLDVPGRMDPPPLFPRGNSPASITVALVQPADHGGTYLTAFSVRYRKTSATTWTIQNPQTTGYPYPPYYLYLPTSHNLINLSSSTEYEVQVRAHNAKGWGEWSESSTLTTRAAANLECAAAPNGVFFNWGNDSNRGYFSWDWTVFYVNQRFGFQYSADNRVTWVPENPADTGLTSQQLINGWVPTYNNDQYWAFAPAEPGNRRVYGRTTLWTSNNYATVHSSYPIETSCLASVAPDAPVLTATGGIRQISLSWTTPDDGGSPITGYSLLYREQGVASWTIFSPDPAASDTSAVMTGLANGTTYEVRLAAVNSLGTGDWAFANATTLDVPGAPDAPTLTPSDMTLDASWTAPSNDGGSAITDYDVEYRIKDTDSVAPGDQPGTWTDKPHTGTSTTATISGLVNGTAYQVQVRAVNAVGEGPWSPPGEGTPLRPTLQISSLQCIIGGKADIQWEVEATTTPVGGVTSTPARTWTVTYQQSGTTWLGSASADNSPSGALTVTVTADGETKSTSETCLTVILK